MKRSEMLTLIKNNLKEYSLGGSKAKFTFDEQTEDLLSQLEEVGMLPPYRQRTKEEKKLFDAIDQFNYIHSWEK